MGLLMLLFGFTCTFFYLFINFGKYGCLVCVWWCWCVWWWWPGGCGGVNWSCTQKKQRAPSWFLLLYPKSPCTPSKPTLSRTYMPIEVSYEELLRDGHTSNQHVQLLLEMSLNAVIKTYLRGVSTNNVITLRTKSPTSSFTKIILSPCHLISTTPSLRLLSITMSTPFLVTIVLVYQ
jgi:hypothetical protein